MKIKREKPVKLNTASLHLGKSTFEEIGKLASAGVVLNIKRGEQADGSAIKSNAPSTQLRKEMRKTLYRGRAASLIDRKHRFIQSGSGSWRWFAYDDHATIEPASQELRRLSGYVQQKGYTGWFGVSQRARRLIRRVIKRRLREIVKGRV